ncbi:hypothetical protein AB0L94_36920, partial [Streptomyces sp. NPDC051993]
PLLGMSARAAVMIGTILVVSGPTVVAPLLGFVRPKDRLQHILIWEGSLIDPVGGVLGALVFHAVVAGSRHHLSSGMERFLGSMGIGVAGGAVGAALLWVLFRVLRLGEVLGTTAQLAAVIGVAAFCDVLRDDTGLIAAVVMGLAVANLPGMDVPARRPFFETLVSLILGLLFISISATVTPHSLRHVWLPALGLAAFLVLVVRPLVAVVSTFRTDLTRGERGFIGWMAPRGIVAAATALTFSAGLVAKGIGGASKILPATFVVIVATVTLYGLTASPVARRLGVVRPSRSRPLTDQALKRLVGRIQALEAHLLAAGGAPRADLDTIDPEWRKLARTANHGWHVRSDLIPEHRREAHRLRFREYEGAVEERARSDVRKREATREVRSREVDDDRVREAHPSCGVPSCTVVPVRWWPSVPRVRWRGSPRRAGSLWWPGTGRGRRAWCIAG